MGLRMAALCAVLFACSGYLVGGRPSAFRVFDARVMPWVEPGWRMSRPVRAKKLFIKSTLISADDALAGGIGGLAGIVLAVVVIPQRPLISLPAAAIGATVAVGTFQQSQRRRTLARDHRLSDEVPQVADLLALHISAGLSIHDGIRAVSEIIDGLVAQELRRISEQIDQGSSVGAALRAAKSRSTAVLWVGFIDALIGCIERGAPVAVTMRSQAQDARSSRHHQVMADAGRREVGMLAPVVFLTLPVTVAVALLPGFMAFKSGL